MRQLLDDELPSSERWHHRAPCDRRALFGGLAALMSVWSAGLGSWLAMASPAPAQAKLPDAPSGWDALLGQALHWLSETIEIAGVPVPANLIVTAVVVVALYGGGHLHLRRRRARNGTGS